MSGNMHLQSISPDKVTFYNQLTVDWVLTEVLAVVMARGAWLWVPNQPTHIWPREKLAQTGSK